MGSFISDNKKKNIYIFNWRLIPPVTGGEIYDYEIGMYLVRNGYVVKFIEEKDLFQYKRKQLIESIILILRLGSIVNNTVMVFDEVLHKRVCLFCLFLRLFSSVKLIAIVHHLRNPLEERIISRRIDMFFEWLFLNLMHKIVVNSEYTKRQVLSLGVNKSIEVIYPATNIPKKGERKVLPGEKVNILFVGNLERRKGLDILLRALETMNKQNTDWQLRVVGETSFNHEYTKICVDLANKFGISKNVSFLGKIEKVNLDKEYKNADIFVLPSFHEGYGMVIREAASYGLPIIATNVGAIPELVEDGKSAILVEPGDIGGLRNALFRLIKDKELREMLGKNALERVDFDYNWDKVGKRFEEFI